MITGFKFVAADLTTRSHTFSYLDALRTGDWLKAEEPTKHDDPCPHHPGDGICVAHTVRAASSGGQPTSSAVGLIVSYGKADVLAESEGKTRVRKLKVVDIFDPIQLIKAGLCTNLYGANLTGANLTRANLYGANLAGALNVPSYVQVQS